MLFSDPMVAFAKGRADALEGKPANNPYRQGTSRVAYDKGYIFKKTIDTKPFTR